MSDAWKETLAQGLRNHIDDERFDALFTYVISFVNTTREEEKKELIERIEKEKLSRASNYNAGLSKAIEIIKESI